MSRSPQANSWPIRKNAPSEAGFPRGTWKSRTAEHGGGLAELGGSRWTIPNLGGYVLERDDDHFVLGPCTALLDHELDADAVVDPAAE